jgi:protein TonB
LRRYEQIISLSIQRNKVYPAEAKTQGLQGQAVIRIRINRQGNILYSRIEKPTRYPILNEAIAEMVRLSNPVPAVPVNYPAGNLFEFLIPVSFRLE